MKTRVPHDPEYTALLGQAIYLFAYYEWAVIYLIQQFKPGFVYRYSRGQPMTSGQVRRMLESILSNPATSFGTVTRQELDECHTVFQQLVEKRNALIHAHPITDYDGSQILNYQTSTDKSLPDVRWPIGEIKEVIQEFDAAACAANGLLHRLLKGAPHHLVANTSELGNTKNP